MAKTVFSLLFCLIFPFKNQAWNAEGHRMILEICCYYLDAAKKDSLKKYLSNQSLYAQTKHPFSKLHHHSQLNFNSTIDCNISYKRIDELILKIKQRQDSMQSQLHELIILISELHQPMRTANSLLNVSHQTQQKEDSLFIFWENLFNLPVPAIFDQCLTMRLNKGQWLHHFTPEEKKFKSTPEYGISYLPPDWWKISSKIYSLQAEKSIRFLPEQYASEYKGLLMVQLHNAGLNLANILKKVFS